MRVRKEDIGFNFGCLGFFVFILTLFEGEYLFGFLFFVGACLLGYLFHKFNNG
jgi:hypothetical protein